MLNVSALNSDVDLLTRYHQLYYTLGFRGKTWTQTYWMGIRTLKLPSDLWMYQELLHRLRPDLIVETGTHHGGSALFLSQMCDLLGSGEVVTVDIEALEGRPQHPRLTYLMGSSVSPEIVEQVRQRAAGKTTVLVILDSDHSCAHVLRELEIYQGLVTPGSYLVVEDTNVNGHPVFFQHGPGPMEAVEAFLKTNTEFEVDGACEKFLLTFNPNGFLLKRAG